MRPGEVNAATKALNDATERELSVDVAAEIQTLRDTTFSRALNVRERARLRELRETTVDLNTRRAHAFTLNNDPDFVEYEFSIVNGRINSRKRSYEELADMLRARLRR